MTSYNTPCLKSIMLSPHETNSKETLPCSAPSGVLSSNLGLERLDDRELVSLGKFPLSICSLLLRRHLACSPLVLLQVCVCSFVTLFLTCLGWVAWRLLHFLWFFDSQHGESTSDVYNKTDVKGVQYHLWGQNTETIFISKKNYQTPLIEWWLQCILALLVLFQEGTLRYWTGCQWRCCVLVWGANRLPVSVLFVSCFFLEYLLRNMLRTG